jgi:hypothetical protein
MTLCRQTEGELAGDKLVVAGFDLQGLILLKNRATALRARQRYGLKQRPFRLLCRSNVHPIAAPTDKATISQEHYLRLQVGQVLEASRVASVVRASWTCRPLVSNVA